MKSYAMAIYCPQWEGKSIGSPRLQCWLLLEITYWIIIEN